MLGRIEDVAPLPDVEQEIEGKALVPEGVRYADRKIGLAIVPDVDEVGRAERQARGRIDQQLALAARAVGSDPQVELTGERHGG